MADCAPKKRGNVPVEDESIERSSEEDETLVSNFYLSTKCAESYFYLKTLLII